MSKTAVKHPAQFSKALIPRFIEILDGYSNVLDPFAGTGGIHKLQEYGFETVGLEIELEWADMHHDTILGNALELTSMFPGKQFDAICTSPCYGNRMADHHNAKDNSLRRTYKHDLGHDLHVDNAGAMQWGDEYRRFHTKAWTACGVVLRPGGLFVLNIKDHIRKKQRQHVAGWHVTTLCRIGFDLLFQEEVVTPGMRFGANGSDRLPAEMIYVLQKPVGSVVTPNKEQKQNRKKKLK